MRNFIDCLREAVAGKIITDEQADKLRAHWTAIKAQGHDDAKAKDILVKDLEGEQQAAERAALLNEGARVRLIDRVQGWTNHKGETDIVQGWVAVHFRRADQGQFKPNPDKRMVMSAPELQEAIWGAFLQETNAAAHEFRKGAVFGDKRRTSKIVAAINPGASRVQTRAREVIRAMKGEGTGDPIAQGLADTLAAAVERMRVRFNEAGGMVGKLEGWTPQYYDGEAMLNFARKHGIEALIDAWQPRIDWQKTRSLYSGRAFSPDEQRSILKEAFRKITTDGYMDEEITAAPPGKGALWKQHADHRFLHYKSADDWLAFAKQFGNADPIGSIFDWARMMSRDIAHMELFGPNAVANRQYVANWVAAQAHSARTHNLIIDEQKTKLKTLQSSLLSPNPEYERLSDDYADTLKQMGDLQNSRDGAIYRATQQMGRDPGPRARAYRQKYDELSLKALELAQKLSEFDSGVQPKTIADLDVERQIIALVEEMRKPIVVAATGNPVGYARLQLQYADALWNDLRGTFSTPVDSRIADTFSIARNTTAAALLGKAVLSSISDLATGTAARAMIGMGIAKANPVRLLIETIRQYTPANRQEAMRAYLNTEAAISSQYQLAAHAGKLHRARAISGFVADRVISMQGLNAVTQGGKIAFARDFFGMFADHVDKSWSDLPGQVRMVLEKGGFSWQEWNDLRRIPLYDAGGGATYLRPNEVLAVNRDMGEKYLAMMYLWRRYAVIESTPEGRALLIGTTQRGTIPGEIARGFAQLKGFPVTVALTHIGKLHNDITGGRGGVGTRDFAAFIVTGSLLGLLAMAMKDISAGRDPRRWLDEETYLDPNVWGAALLQSGGLGIYGDFLFSNVNRHGKGLEATVAGPVWQIPTDIINLTIGNTMDVASNAIRHARGEPTKPTRAGRELANAIRRYTPTVWWNRLILDRTIFDGMQRILDPEAPQAFQREVLRRRKDYKQEYWWEPGQTMPSRAPDLGRPFAVRN